MDLGCVLKVEPIAFALRLGERKWKESRIEPSRLAWLPVALFSEGRVTEAKRIKFQGEDSGH